MKAYTKRSRRRRKRRNEEPEASPLAEAAGAAAARSGEHLGALYQAGPVQKLGPRAPESAARPRQPALEATLAPTHGAGTTHEQSAFGQTVRLQGRTEAKYDGGKFHTENVRIHSAEKCAECGGKERVHVTGVLVATYRVRTTVTLPSADDFSGLTECQRQRVRDAINNVLAPHEQEHVAAFETYNGTTRTPFDLTLCRSEFDGAIKSMFEGEEQSRRASAQAASDALDPFHFDADLNCEEQAAEETTPEAGEEAPASAQSEAPQEAAPQPTATAETETA